MLFIRKSVLWYCQRRKEWEGICGLSIYTEKERVSTDILELKYDKSTTDASGLIYEKHYIGRVKDYQEVLLVGINYDKKAMHHERIIEIYKAV